MPPKETDVRKRTAIATASSAQRKPTLDFPDADLAPEAYLDKTEEDLNLRVDAAVATLGEGLSELVRMSAVGDKDPFTVAEEGFQIDIRVENMIKATENLLALSHTLKMMHLLNDHEAASAAQTRIRDERATQVEAKRQEAADLLKDLLAKSNEG